MRFSTGLLMWTAGLMSFVNPIMHAQRFEAEVNPKNVVVGQRFELRYLLHDAPAERFIPPNPAGFSGFRVVMGPSEMRSSGFRNGQSYRFQSWTYLLEATKPGAYPLPSASVRLSGNTLTATPPRINVTKARLKDGIANPESEDDVFIQAEIAPESAFPGQQVIYRIVLYTRRDVSEASLIDPPDVGDIYTKELQRFDTRTKRLEWKGKTYVVRTLYEMALFPHTEGRFTIGPARLQVGIEQSSRFPGLSIPVPVVLQTQPTALSVVPLPKPAPDDFSGGVGAYFLEANLENESVPVGEATLLTLRVRGNGDSKRILPPKILGPEGLDILDPEIVEQEDYENGEEWVHTRTLQYVVLAKSEGRFGMLPTLTFYNPDSNRYIMLTAADSLFLEVTAGASGTSVDVPELENGSAGTDRLDLMRWLPYVLLTIAIIAIGGLLFWQKKQNRNAEKHLVFSLSETEKWWPHAESLVDGPPESFFKALEQALEAQLSLSLKIPLADLNKQKVYGKLMENPGTEQLAASTLRLWETCEKVLYAGLPAGESQWDVWRKALELKKQLQEMS